MAATPRREVEAKHRLRKRKEKAKLRALREKKKGFKSHHITFGSGE